MAWSLRLAGVACVLALTGCNLGYADRIYNQTSCPIRLQANLDDRKIIDYEPYVLVPGNREIAIVRYRSVKYARIVVIDHNNVEHRYDADALAALRPAGASNEDWSFTDSGLIFLRDEPEKRDLEKLTKQPCGGLQKVQPPIS